MTAVRTDRALKEMVGLLHGSVAMAERPHSLDVCRYTGVVSMCVSTACCKLVG